MEWPGSGKYSLFYSAYFICLNFRAVTEILALRKTHFSEALKAYESSCNETAKKLYKLSLLDDFHEFTSPYQNFLACQSDLIQREREFNSSCAGLADKVGTFFCRESSYTSHVSG
jgi:hypothetical protein